jgi:PAS domain S-box-containing protein
MSEDTAVSATLESVLSTEELNARPFRRPDYEMENRAILEIARHMADSPRTALQRLAEAALEICHAGSAGVSLLSREGGDFHWVAVAGAWQAYTGTAVPRDWACDRVVGERNATQLFSRPARHFTYFANLEPAIQEMLVSPLYVEGNTAGAIWAMAHDSTRKFDAEDQRLIEGLGKLAAAAYPLRVVSQEQQDQQEQSRALRDFNARLLISSVRQHEMTEQAESAEAAVRASEEWAVSELAGTRRLQQTSTKLIRAENAAALYEEIADAAVAIMHSEYASVQILHPERGASGELQLLAYRGFTPEAAARWEWVRIGTNSTPCEMALLSGTRIVVADVQQCEAMAGSDDLAMCLQTGIHAVQSTPLVSRSGQMLGMISTHWRHAHQPAEREFQLLDVLARQAADFIERSSVEAALHESEERYRTLVSVVTDVPWSTDSEGRFVTPQPMWTTYTGQSWKECRDFGWADALHPEDRPGILDLWGRSLKMGTLHQAKGRMWNAATQQYRHAEVRATPMLDADGRVREWVGACTDIEDRTRSEIALRESAERFRFMAESMPQKIFTAAPTGVPEYFNRQWTDFTGLGFDQLRQDGWTQVVHPGEAQENVLAWEHAIGTGEPFKIVHRLRRADGFYRWHLSRAHAMRDAAGEIVMWIGSSTDIQQEKETEDELRRANEDLRQFAFAASHDLQEPLRTITSYSQLLLRSYHGQLDGQAALCAGYIAEGTERMRALLADLLSFTAAGTDVSEPARSIDLDLVLQESLQNLKTVAVETGAAITSDHLPAVEGRHGHFVQLFQNLIGNALKYRGELSPRVHVGAERGPGEWIFRVSDNGIGIDPKHHREIFKIFKRLHSRAIPGTGIGLALCQRVVERYGGRIWVESESGRGSTFCFTLPLMSGADGWGSEIQQPHD